MTDNKTVQESLPKIALDFIDTVVKKVRYRKKIRQEVRDELTDHFYMALKDCTTDEEKLRAAEKLIAEFGDVKILAGLIRRGKKRCRPLWKKAIIATFKVVGVLILLVILRAGYLYVGTPVVSVDYVEWLNDFVRNGRDEQFNAYPHYLKAVELAKIKMPEEVKSIMDSEEEINEKNVDQVKAFLLQMQPAFDELRTGASMPYSWPRYKLDSKADLGFKVPSGIFFSIGLIDSLMPFIADAKKLARKMYSLQIQVKLKEVDIDGALDDSFVIINFGRHMTGKGLVLQQLVGVAVEAMGNGSIIKIIQTEDVTTDTLKRCQERMELFGKGDEFTVDIRGEKVFLLDYIQHTFTDDGSGNGRVLLNGLPVAVGDPQKYVTGFVFGSYPDRREVIESLDSFFEEAHMLMNLPPWQLSANELEIAEATMLEDSSLILRILTPALFKTRLLSWRLMAERRAIIAVCGVLRYEKDKGEFPVDLEAVVSAGYLKEVPVDPFSGKEFVYKRTEESFILYSFGTDMDDDGGVPYINSNGGRQRKWGDGSGDSIFWPELKKTAEK